MFCCHIQLTWKSPSTIWHNGYWGFTKCKGNASQMPALESCGMYRMFQDWWHKFGTAAVNHASDYRSHEFYHVPTVYNIELTSNYIASLVAATSIRRLITSSAGAEQLSWTFGRGAKGSKCSPWTLQTVVKMLKYLSQYWHFVKIPLLTVSSFGPFAHTDAFDNPIVSHRAKFQQLQKNLLPYKNFCGRPWQLCQLMHAAVWLVLFKAMHLSTPKLGQNQSVPTNILHGRLQTNF